MKDFKRYLITSALPYANGPIHIGHLAGVYVPADIYVRYLRSINKDVLFIGGSDEHGVPITLKAKEEGKIKRVKNDVISDIAKTLQVRRGVCQLDKAISRGQAVTVSIHAGRTETSLEKCRTCPNRCE